MAQRLTNSQLANLEANAIYTACAAFQGQFKAITSRARTRFAQCDWHGMQADAAERLDIYRQVIEQTVAEIRHALADRVNDAWVWASIKAVYSGLIAECDDWEIAETFFNSITRRVFTTVGVDPQIEFVDTDFETPPTPSRLPVYRTYQRACDIATLIATILPLGAVKSLAAYDGVVVGAPMIMGWHRAALRFLRQNRGVLQYIPLAVFVTCMRLTQTHETSVSGVPVYVDEQLPKPPETAGRLRFKERYARLANADRPSMRRQYRPARIFSCSGRAGRCLNRLCR